MRVLRQQLRTWKEGDDLGAISAGKVAVIVMFEDVYET
jgi:hypothetical protein